MLKTLITIGSLAGVLSLASIGHTQAMPTAVAKGALQVGGGFSYAKPDYAQTNIQGFSGFVDYNLSLHLGVEADIHHITLVTPSDVGENSYLFGPRFTYPRGRFSLYGKALFGVGTIVIQEVADNPEGGAGNYFAYGLGGGLDVLATRHIVVRAIDFEYQHWSYGSGLTPIAITVGAAYRFR
jgi:opacity protein-like surface antigen